MFEKLDEGDYGIVYAFGDKVLKKYKVPGCIDHLILQDLQDTGCVPKLYGFKEDRFVVMERIYGETLDEVNPYDVLGYAWESKLRLVLYKVVMAGYLPCDISFSNIMLSEDKEFKLIDVGNYRSLRDNCEPWMISRHIEKAMSMFRRNFLELEDEDEAYA